MCDRVAIIRNGEVIAVGHVEELLAQSESQVMWRVHPRSKALSLLREDSRVQALHEREEMQAETIVTNMNPEDIPDINKMLLQAEVDVHGIELYQPNLEDLFLQLTKGEEIR